jgi:dipeptidase E
MRLFLSSYRFGNYSDVLTARVEDEEFLYGGESAGAIIATPSLRGVEFGDDPYVEVEGYSDDDVWDGLGFISYSLVPHYESSWEGAERMVEVLEEENIPYKTLSDSQVLVGGGEQVALLS